MRTDLHIDKIDFSRVAGNEKCIQDWYNRAKNCTSPWYIEYFANYALCHDKQLSSTVATRFFEKEKISNVYSMDSPCLAKPSMELGDFQVSLEHTNSRGNSGRECVSQYHYENTEPFNNTLMRKLVNYSERSQVHKLLVAWYLFENGLETALSKEYFKYWETDFEILDTIWEENNGKITRIVLRTYSNICRSEFDNLVAELERALKDSYREICQS